MSGNFDFGIGRAAALAVILCCPTLGISAQAGSPTDDLFLREGYAALRAHAFDRAESLALNALKANPRSAQAMYLMGNLLQARKRPEDSLGWFTRAAAIAPPSAEDLRVVGLDYSLLNDYADAFHWFTRSVELAPDSAEAWYDLARSQMMLGDLQAAEAPLQRALALQPRMVKAKNNLGLVYEAESRPLDAAMAYREAIEWGDADGHPSEQPLLNYGSLLLEQHSGEALPLLLKALAIAPDDVKCNEQLARAFDQQGNHAQAIASMSHAVQLSPIEPRLHFELGQMYKHDGQVEQAAKELTLSQKLYGAKSAEAGR